MNKFRSKILILSHIMQFSLGKDINGIEYAGLKSMRFSEVREPKIGALVALSSAPASVWYLSWVVDFKLYEGGYVYTLESIETGELCDWSNVSLWEYSTEQISKHPEWRWVDKQHQFNDRWFSVCGKLTDYWHIPIRARFLENELSVILGIRAKFNIDNFIVEKSFDDYRKVKIIDMKEFYVSIKNSH